MYQLRRTSRLGRFPSTLLALAVVCLLLSPTAKAGELDSDKGLVHFILSNDVVLSRVLGECRNVKVTRAHVSGLATFNVKASCLTKANPEEDLDCPSYEVTASGTVDNSIQATVRHLGLNLHCSA